MVFGDREGEMRAAAMAWVALMMVGCTVGRPMTAPSPTPVRASLIDAAAPLLEKQLRNDGWEFQTGEIAKRGQTAVNAEELWDENTTFVTFTAKRPDAEPKLLRPEESTVLLRGMRSDIRKVIQSWGGEALDTTEGEGYRERWLIIPYKLDRVLGTVRLRIGPATDRAEETMNRLDLVIREQPER